MRLEVIGIGGAGCRIVDRLRRHSETEQFVVDAFAFDTDPATLESLQSISDDHRHRFGTATGGLGGDVDAGFEAGDEHVDELSRVIDRGMPTRAEGFLLVVGLGGATGGGTVPSLAADLETLYDAPVYVVGTLPTTDETETATETVTVGDDDSTGSPVDRNAARTLDRLDGVVDAIIPFDNESWLRTSEELTDARSRLNEELVTRLAAAFGAWESGADGVQAEQTIDANDLDRTFGDDTTVATIGYAVQGVTTESDGGSSLFGLGLLGREDEPEVETSAAISAVETVIHKSVRGKLTVDCDRSDADRALLAVGGPPTWLNRRAIVDGRSWLGSEIESRTVRGGDAPDPDADAVFAVAILSDVRDAPRLQSLWNAK